MNPPPTEIDWREAVARGAFKEALGKLRALELVNQGNTNAKAALLGLIECQELIRQGKLERAERSPRDGWFELGISTVGFSESLQSICQTQDASGLQDLIANAHPLTLAEAHNSAGKLLLEQPELAATHFRQALEADPGHYRALTNLGNIQLEDGQLDEAINTYRQALTLEPEYATAHNNLAAALRRQGKIGESLQALKRAQRLSVKRLQEEARHDAAQSGQSLKTILQHPYSRWVLLGLVALIAYRFVQR